jgi:hypothetical protein
MRLIFLEIGALPVGGIQGLNIPALVVDHSTGFHAFRDTGRTPPGFALHKINHLH